MPSLKKPFLLRILPPLFIPILFCSNPFKALELPYAPPAVFVGIVNDDYDSLPGNPQWPNRCSLTGDTVCLYFYSKNFSQVNTIRSGDLLSITLLPCANDSLIGTKDAYLHMARYHETNCSYDIAPRDTLFDENRLAMRAIRLSRARGGPIVLDNIEVIAERVTGTAAPTLIIKKGRISGSIE